MKCFQFRFLLFLVNLALCNCIFTKQNIITLNDNQVQVNWYDADNFCRKQGMRLPDYKEMREAKQSGKIVLWDRKKDIKQYKYNPQDYWLSQNNDSDARFFPMQLEYDDVQVFADKVSKKFVSCVKDFDMEKRIKLSKAFANWSSYQGYMTNHVAEVECNKLGMQLPTGKDFRNAYFDRITNEWIEEYKSKGLSYGGVDTNGFNLFTPDVGIYSFSKWTGNAHVRCIRK